MFSYFLRFTECSRLWLFSFRGNFVQGLAQNCMSNCQMNVMANEFPMRSGTELLIMVWEDQEGLGKEGL